MKIISLKNVLLVILLTLTLVLTACAGEVPGGGDCTNGVHVDADGNELCDDCAASVVIILDFYALNDLHGKLEDGASCVGADELSTYLSGAYKTDDAAIVLSSGDMWQGSAESNLTKGLIVTEWMNEMDFVSMTLGNHEFDWGSDYIRENAKLADFPILAINIVDSASGKPADFCKPSVIVERDGVKIGIIGAIGDCKSSISASQVSDVDFKVGRELTELVKAESARLRKAGCELIVYSIHDGANRSMPGISSISDVELASYYDIELSDGYVDIVFEGHSHMSYVCKDSKGVYHLQNGGYDNGISHVEIKLNVVTDKVDIRAVEIVESYEYAHLDDHPVIDELITKYDDYIAFAMREIGVNSEYRDAYYIRQLVADLYIQRGLEKWGDSYDIVLGGGYISARDPGMLPEGMLHYYDVMSVLPFDNDVCLCAVKGENMLRQFINSTNANYFIGYSEYGISVKDTIDPNATYYIISDRYSVDYAPNGLTEIDTLGENVFARDLVADFAQAGGLGSGIPDNPEIPDEPETPDEPEIPDEPDVPTPPYSTSGYTLTSIPDAIRIAEGMKYNFNSNRRYFIKGKIVTEPNAKYGNVTVEDENGVRLYVYGIYGTDGCLFEELEEKPAVGDTVILYGALFHYKNNNNPDDIKPEMKSAMIVAINPDEIDPISVKEALEIAATYTVNNTFSTDSYYVIGKIESIVNTTYGNMYIMDETGERIYIYGVYGESNTRFDGIANPPSVGDTVIVLAVIGRYNDYPQLKNAILIKIVEEAE